MREGVEGRHSAAERQACHAEEGERGEHLAGLQEPHAHRAEVPSAHGPFGQVGGGLAAACEAEDADQHDAGERHDEDGRHWSVPSAAAMVVVPVGSAASRAI
jgi:hypothetical protein